MKSLSDTVSFFLSEVIEMEDGTKTFVVTKKGKIVIVDVLKAEKSVVRDPKNILAQSVTRLD